MVFLKVHVKFMRKQEEEKQLQLEREFENSCNIQYIVKTY